MNATHICINTHTWATKGDLLRFHDRSKDNKSSRYVNITKGPSAPLLWIQDRDVKLVETFIEASHVDDVYEELSEGQRVHMLNKLAKNGYDGRTKATRDRHAQLRAAKLAPPAKTYSIGDKVYFGKQEYIIAQVDHGRCALINTDNGNRKREARTVAQVLKITEKEFKTFS